MGLLKHLLFWPVTGPEFLTRFSMEKVAEATRRELTDDQAIKEDLLALQMQLELGEIDDAEYVAREAAVMARLRDVRAWREEFGMGGVGGPVRVARDPDPAAEAPDPPPGGVSSAEGASIELGADWERSGG